MLQSGQLVGVEPGYILDMAQPIIQQAELMLLQSGPDATASIMSADNNMLDLEYLNGKLDYGETIQVGMHNHVGNIAMNKDFAGRQTTNHIGGNPAVRTTDPQVLWRLLLRELGKKLGILFLDRTRPFRIAVHEAF